MDSDAATISALLDSNEDRLFESPDAIISNFSTPLRTKFEDYNLWLRFGLALSLSGHHRNAIQSFSECLRIDQSDPLPAMLAAKISLLNLNDPERGLKLVHNAIDRCRTNDRYRRLSPILSKCYLLASVINAHIYEREPESIKQFRRANLEASLEFINLAKAENPSDYLVHFHAALHEARQQSFTSAIDNIRQAIKLNPHHLPSVQLLILSLSALKLYDDALVLCESALREFEDNLTLLYIKCNLEQCSSESKGYKSALNTAQEMLRCIRNSSILGTGVDQKVKSAAKDQSLQQQQQQQQNQQQQQQQPQQQNTNQNQNQSSNGPSATKNGTNTETSKPTIDLFAEQRNYSRTRAVGPLANEAAIWFLVAEIYIKMGNIKDAELCADEGSNLEDVALSFQMMFTRGLIAKAKNNLMEAKSFFQSCLALNPRHAMASQQIAHVHYLLGNYPTAEKFLKDSLDLDSSCHMSWYYLSLVFIETNQHDKASECAKKSSRLEELAPAIPLSTIISPLTLI